MAKSDGPLRDATQVAICPDQKALSQIRFIEFIIGTNGIVIVNPKTPSLTLFTRPFKNDPASATKTIARRATELLNAYFAIVDVAHEKNLKAARQPSKAWGLALEYLRTKNWPAYSVTDEKMQLAMVAFADARMRYLDNGGRGMKCVTLPLCLSSPRPPKTPLLLPRHQRQPTSPPVKLPPKAQKTPSSSAVPSLTTAPLPLAPGLFSMMTVSRSRFSRNFSK